MSVGANTDNEIVQELYQTMNNMYCSNISLESMTKDGKAKELIANVLKFISKDNVLVCFAGSENWNDLVGRILFGPMQFNDMIKQIEMKMTGN